MFERILLAVDGSEHALRAARQAADLARNMRSKELRVIVSYDTIPIYLGEPNMQIAYVNRKSEAEKILNDALKEIGEIPGKLVTNVLEGDTASRIIESAEVHKSDIIVLGSRGLGSLAGLLLGSVSQKVVAHAPCPVLIIR
ncbi:MAG TPA: universal stress protein [Anaerolineales bacterium]|nr:universal stress protein [Anaerolineae bacterium]HRJ54926.1 universal stress protein [Anaerolineales bacterium]HRK89049.1 universal stress protein [Anaerolineales bacterium]